MIYCRFKAKIQMYHRKNLFSTLSALSVLILLVDLQSKECISVLVSSCISNLAEFEFQLMCRNSADKQVCVLLW